MHRFWTAPTPETADRCWVAAANLEMRNILQHRRYGNKMLILFISAGRSEAVSMSRKIQRLHKLRLRFAIGHFAIEFRMQPSTSRPKVNPHPGRA